MKNRTDRQTAILIDLAVNMAGSHGVATGARMLFEQGVSLEVAQRVLLRPAERRQAPRQGADPIRDIQRRLAGGAVAAR